MEKYPKLKIFPGEGGKRIWRQEVHQPPSRKLTDDERRNGLRCDAADGIYIVTVSAGTPTERFEMAHLLNLASEGTRSTQANGFVPTDHYDSAIAVVNSRVVGGVIADKGRFTHRTMELKAGGGYKTGTATGEDARPVIFDLWVHPAHRQKGLGRQLLMAIAEHFGRDINQMGYRFPISKKARLLLWSMGIKKVEGCN